MPGDPTQCRVQAASCLALSRRAWRPEVKEIFTELAQTWRKLAAESEADQALFKRSARLIFSSPLRLSHVLWNLLMDRVRQRRAY